MHCKSKYLEFVSSATPTCNHSVGLKPAGRKPHDYNDIVFATPVGGGSRVCEPSCACDPLQGSSGRKTQAGGISSYFYADAVSTVHM